jgi:uncharacterized protein involved in outer membrane biogenesis
MKFLIRWTLRLLLLLVVLLLISVLLLNTIVRKIVESQIYRQTGLTAKIGSLTIGLRKPEITVHDFVLYNSADFGGSPFIVLPELRVIYDEPALMAHQLHFKLFRFNLAQVNLVEDKNGRRNLDALEKRVPEIADWMNPNHKSRHHEHNKYEFTGIDRLDISLGSASYVRLKPPGQRQEFTLNVSHQVFAGIQSEDDFPGVLFVALLRGTSNFMQSGGAYGLFQLLSQPKAAATN